VEAGGDPGDDLGGLARREGDGGGQGGESERNGGDPGHGGLQ
jgi:hypothetical protein